MGKKIASKANRDGVAEQCSDPTVPKRIAVDLALLGHDDARLRDVELSILNATKPPHANTLDLRRTVPGSGESLSLGLLEEIHDLQRFPRRQAFVSSCRLVTCAKESTGTRDGTAGPKSGNAYLQGAFAAAAVRFLRANPAGPKSRGRLEKQPGKGKALTVLAHQRARAVYDLWPRHTAVARHTCRTG
jgi:transposase